MKDDRIVLRYGIYGLLTYSIISFALYFLLYFAKIGDYIRILNTGIDILLFIPIYIIIISIVYSYKRVAITGVK